MENTSEQVTQIQQRVDQHPRTTVLALQSGSKEGKGRLRKNRRTVQQNKRAKTLIKRKTEACQDANSKVRTVGKKNRTVRNKGSVLDPSFMERNRSYFAGTIARRREFRGGHFPGKKKGKETTANKEQEQKKPGTARGR